MDAHGILICIADHQWTLEALHLGSALALDLACPITLVKFVPVDHPSYLGMAEAYWRYTVAEREQVRDYVVTLEKYGADFSVGLFQYVTHTDAIVSAAEQWNAAVVFATLPQHWFFFWRRLALWSFRRRLAGQHRALFTLDNPLEAVVWPPPRVSSPILPVTGH